MRLFADAENEDDDARAATLHRVYCVIVVAPAVVAVSAVARDNFDELGLQYLDASEPGLAFGDRTSELKHRRGLRSATSGDHVVVLGAADVEHVVVAEIAEAADAVAVEDTIGALVVATSVVVRLEASAQAMIPAEKRPSTMTDDVLALAVGPTPGFVVEPKQPLHPELVFVAREFLVEIWRAHLAVG